MLGSPRERALRLSEAARTEVSDRAANAIAADSHVTQGAGATHLRLRWALGLNKGGARMSEPR